MTPLVHAIVGCGRVAPNHADGFSRVPGCTVRWACDRDPAAARALAGAWGIERVCTDLRQVLSDPAVDSVSIATGHDQHAPLAAAALRAGKHVLVEKPMALSTRDAAGLVTLAAERGRVLSVVSQHRYDPLVEAVKGWIDGGALGTVLGTAVHLQCRREPAYYGESPWRGSWAGEGGSVLANQGYHYLDLMRWLAGPVREVRAMMGTLRLGEVMETEDSFAAVLRHAGGALSTLSLTAASDVFWRSRLDVMGTEGSVSFDLDHPDTLHFAHGGERLRAQAEAVRAAPRDEPPAGLDYYGVSHRRQIADFCRALRGGPAVRVDGAEGAATLEVLAALYRSAGAPAWVDDAARQAAAPSAPAPVAAPC